MSDFTNYPNYESGNGNIEESEAESKLGEMADSAKTKIRSAATNVADKFRGAGRYVRETDMRGMATDAGDFIRRYPVQSLLAGVGLGYLVGRIRRS